MQDLEDRSLIFEFHLCSVAILLVTEFVNDATQVKDGRRHRRRQVAGLDDDQKQDAEPDWVEADAPTIAAELDMRYGVRIGARGPRSLRAVTHYWITPERVDKAVAAVAEVMENAAS